MKRESVVGVLTGAAAGLLAGLAGVGGGVIMVPLMVTFLGATQHQAHGTSLAIIVLIALSGTIQYASHGYVNWWLAAALAAGSIIGAILGAKLMMRVPGDQLRRAFGVFIILVALRMLIWQS